MKFAKGVVIGSMITAGVMMIYSDNKGNKKMLKKGKQILKRMEII